MGTGIQKKMVEKKKIKTYEKGKGKEQGKLKT